MKGIILVFTVLTLMVSSEENPIQSCPKSPNCVCSLKQSKGYMTPLSLQTNITHTNTIIQTVMGTLHQVKLKKQTANYLHYEVTTKVGKYIDDVEFYIEESTKLLHFRSASRKGWYDFGANKRRMKRILKRIQKLSKESTKDSE